MNNYSLKFTNSSNKLILNSLNKPILNSSNKPILNSFNNIYNKKKVFYVCSSGGCGSTVIFNYLKKFGDVYHIHDRYPPDELEYIGKVNTDKDVYSEWFNGVKVPDNELNDYKVIFIYRHPIQVIFSRFAQRNGPNIMHLQHIKCNNGGNINIYDVLKTKNDLYKLEDFFDNYTTPRNKNYNIYCIKYELFWSNISIFNNLMGIPDDKRLYPVRIEVPKKAQFVSELSAIYYSLINKMSSMRFIEIVVPIKNEENV